MQVVAQEKAAVVREEQLNAAAEAAAQQGIAAAVATATDARQDNIRLAAQLAHFEQRIAATEAAAAQDKLRLAEMRAHFEQRIAATEAAAAQAQEDKAGSDSTGVHLPEEQPSIPNPSAVKQVSGSTTCLAVFSQIQWHEQSGWACEQSTLLWELISTFCVAKCWAGTACASGVQAKQSGEGAQPLSSGGNLPLGLPYLPSAAVR